MNSSCGRGRAQMLSTLREVTLSHLVAQRKRNGLAVMEGEPKAPQTVSLENNTLILLDEVGEPCTMQLLVRSSPHTSHLLPYPSLWLLIPGSNSQFFCYTFLYNLLFRPPLISNILENGYMIL